MKYFFAFLAVILTVSNASNFLQRQETNLNDSIDFKKCSASATYTFEASSVDVSPYPIKGGS